MTAAMIATRAGVFTKVFATEFRFHDFQQAYSNYRRFKSMGAEQMRDLGLTSDDIEAATFANFRQVPMG